MRRNPGAERFCAGSALLRHANAAEIILETTVENTGFNPTTSHNNTSLTHMEMCSAQVPREKEDLPGLEKARFCWTMCCWNRVESPSFHVCMSVRTGGRSAIVAGSSQFLGSSAPSSLLVPWRTKTHKPTCGFTGHLGFWTCPIYGMIIQYLSANNS